MLANPYYRAQRRLRLLGDLSHKSSQYKKRGREEIRTFLDSLLAQNLSVYAAAELLSKSSHPVIKKLISIVRESVTAAESIKKERKRRKCTPMKTRKFLLAKDETLLSDQRYQLYNRLIGIEEEAPSIHQIKALRQKINFELEDALFPDEEKSKRKPKRRKNKTSVQQSEVQATDSEQPAIHVDIVPNCQDSTVLDLKKVVQFIFTIHSARFGVDKLPEKVQFKFTFDGRLNAKQEEVLIALVPCNTWFPPQSTYSTFPIAVKQCSEKEAVPTVHKLMQAANDLTLQPFKYSHEGQERQVDVTFVVGSDLKAYWTATDTKYSSTCKPGSDKDRCFCPYCKIRSSEIHSVAVGSPRTDLLPGLNIMPFQFVYCTLHGCIRVTEKFVKKVAEQAQQNRVLPELRADLKPFGIRLYVKEDKFMKVYLDGDSMKRLLGIYKHCKQPKLDKQAGISILKKYYPSDIFGKLLEHWTVVAPILLEQEDVTPEQTQQLQTSVQYIWQYWTLSFAKGMNPYVHIITQHSMELLKIYKSLGRYCQQGLEYANRTQKEIVRNATQHNGGRFKPKTSKQILLQFYRRLQLARDLKTFSDIFEVMDRQNEWKIMVANVANSTLEGVRFDGDCFIIEDGKTATPAKRKIEAPRESTTPAKKRKLNNNAQTVKHTTPPQQTSVNPPATSTSEVHDCEVFQNLLNDPIILELEDLYCRAAQIPPHPPNSEVLIQNNTTNEIIYISDDDE